MDSRIDAQEATFQGLLLLDDVWTGEGRAEYPTISTFPYREALTIQAVPGQPRFFVLERTQRKNDAGEWVESHWESGFLRVLTDGTVEWLDAQGGGRVEVLRGTLQQTDDALVLQFQSSLVANDARMGDTARAFTLRGDSLSYTMHMSMTNVPDLTLHLEANLTRFVAKSELEERLVSEHAKFLELLAQVPANARTEPNVVGEWSVQDLIAHLIAHEQRALEELNAARRGKRFEIEPHAENAFDDHAVQAARAKSFDEVQREWDESFDELFASVKSLDDADFEPFSPLCVALEDTIDGALGNNSYAHYAEHRPALEEWLRANPR